MASNFVARGPEAYDQIMGRWSRRLAPLFLDFAGLEAGERVADIGCGTGNLTFAIAARSEVASIAALDYEQQFVDAVIARSADKRISARQGDACALPYADGEFDRALSMLVFHFVSDAQRAVIELRRVTRPGGVAAATVWDLYGGMMSHRMAWDTMAAIEPKAIERRAAFAFRPVTESGQLRDAFVAAGFRDVAETLLTIRMDYANFDDFWQPLIYGQGTNAEFIASLPQETQERIVSAVRAAYLCNRPDGPRSFANVAWAVRGVVPG